MISIGTVNSDVLGNGPGCPARAFRRDHAPEGMFGTVPHGIAAPTAVYACLVSKACGNAYFGEHETSEEGIEMKTNGTSTARIPKGMDAGRSYDRV